MCINLSESMFHYLILLGCTCPCNLGYLMYVPLWTIHQFDKALFLIASSCHMPWKKCTGLLQYDTKSCEELGSNSGEIQDKLFSRFCCFVAKFVILFAFATKQALQRLISQLTIAIKQLCNSTHPHFIELAWWKWAWSTKIFAFRLQVQMQLYIPAWKIHATLPQLAYHV